MRVLWATWATCGSRGDVEAVLGHAVHGGGVPLVLGAAAAAAADGGR